MIKAIFIGSFSSLRCYPLENILAENPDIKILGPMPIINHFTSYTNDKFVTRIDFFDILILKFLMFMANISSQNIDNRFFKIMALMRRHNVCNFYNKRYKVLVLRNFFNNKINKIVNLIIDICCLFLFDRANFKIIPDILLCSNYSDIYSQAIARAIFLKNNEIKISAIVHSWDNTYTKNINIVQFHKLFVWGDKQICDMKNNKNFSSTLFSKIGVPGLIKPTKKPLDVLRKFTILIFLGNDKIFLKQNIFVDEYIKNLIDIVGLSELLKNFRVIIRPHPGDVFDDNSYIKYDFIEIDNPSIEHINSMSFNSFSSAKNSLIYSSWDEVNELIDQSDLILTGASTIALQTIILKKPMINMPSSFSYKINHFKLNFFYFLPHIKFLLINRFLNRLYSPLDSAHYTSSLYRDRNFHLNNDYYLNYHKIYSFYNLLDYEDVKAKIEKTFI